jgi:hypothetical protein
MLLFEDTMDKIIISMDSVSIHGNDTLRAERKRVIRVAQNFIDCAHQLSAKATIIQRAWRAHLDHVRDLKKPNAARVIARSIRRLQARRSARDTMRRIREMRALHAHVETLISTFRSDLAALSTQAAEAPCLGSDTLQAVRDDVQQRIAMVLLALTPQSSEAQRSGMATD